MNEHRNSMAYERSNIRSMAGYTWGGTAGGCRHLQAEHQRKSLPTRAWGGSSAQGGRRRRLADLPTAHRRPTSSENRRAPQAGDGKRTRHPRRRRGAAPRHHHLRRAWLATWLCRPKLFAIPGAGEHPECPGIAGRVRRGLDVADRFRETGQCCRCATDLRGQPPTHPPDG